MPWSSKPPTWVAVPTPEYITCWPVVNLWSGIFTLSGVPEIDVVVVIPPEVNPRPVVTNFLLYWLYLILTVVVTPGTEREN